MASYWKSLPKKYCEYCGCWITDNKASVEFHERGKKHIEKKEKKIAQIRKKSHAQFASDKETAEYLQQMEVAAIEKYKQDLSSRGVTLVGKYVSKSVEDKPSPVQSPLVNDPRPRGSIRKSSKMAIIEPRIIPRESAWKEYKTEQGYVYFHNAENGKTTWEKPAGFVSKYGQEAAEAAAKEDLIKAKEEMKRAKEANTSSLDKKRDSRSKDDSEPANKFQRIDPYGSWSVVANKKSLPEKSEAPPLLYKPITSVQPSQLDEEEDTKVRNFSEKVISKIHNDSSMSTTFKKKPPKQRSIRKRT